MLRNLWIFLAFLMLGIVAPPTQLNAQDSFEDLLSRVSGDANALVIINGGDIRKSEFAKREGPVAATEVNRNVFPRQEIERLVQAADLDMSRMAPVWETTIAVTVSDPSIEMIAATVSGRVELLGDVQAVRLPQNAYLVKLGPKLLGVQDPADRQGAARWARQARKPGKVALSPYLAMIAQYPETAGTEVMLGLDLSDMLSPATVRGNLSRSEVLKGRSIDLDSLADLLAGVQGVALGIKFNDKANGKLRIDFADDPSMLSPVAKPLILEKLGDMGMGLEDMESWTVQIRDKTVYLGGTLSKSGLRRILSILDPPQVPLEQPSAVEGPKVAGSQKPSSPGEVDAKTRPTWQYFKELDDILEEVRKPDSKRMITGGQYALWLDRYSRKINQLPIINVDAELLNFGQGAAEALRALASKVRGVNIAVGTQSYNSGVNYYSDTVTGPLGGSVSTTRAEVVASDNRVARRLGKAYSAASSVELMAALENETAAVRRLMTERYKIEF
jgi:hypothetical protein